MSLLTRTLVTLLCLYLAACGAAPRATHSAASAPDAAAMVVNADLQRLIAHDAALEAVLSSTPDCEAACHHLAALCELSERICDLTFDTHDAEHERACADGRARCTRARERTAPVCSCSP